MMNGMPNKHEAQDMIIAACVTAAFKAEAEGRPEMAALIRNEAEKIAKRYGLSDVPGLPGTWRTHKMWRGHRDG